MRSRETSARFCTIHDGSAQGEDAVEQESNKMLWNNTGKLTAGVDYTELDESS